MNDCDSSPCIHGGTCTDGLGRFDCECPQDYAGRQCELGKANYAFYLVTKTQGQGHDLKITLLCRNGYLLCFARPYNILIKAKSKAKCWWDLSRNVCLESIIKNSFVIRKKQTEAFLKNNGLKSVIN